MNAKAKAEFDRLNEQDDRDARIIARATAKLQAELESHREGLLRLEARREALASDLNHLRKLAATVCGLAPQDMDDATLEAIAEMARHIGYPGY